MKICVLGFSGSGKSTLARFLGERLNLPVLHLDCVFWYGDWQSRTREEQEIKVNEFIAANPESWVIDGNYLKIFRERAELCDEIYFLNFNRFFCYRQALKRYKSIKERRVPTCLAVKNSILNLKNGCYSTVGQKNAEMSLKTLFLTQKAQFLSLKSKKI